ncbi:hypothetical protein BGZ46_006472, partial [Entomortierella lignicola]
MNEMYAQFNADITKGDTSLLKDVHVYSSGLKSYCTKLGADGIEEARRALGGHGFSLFSGMIDFHRQFLATVTYEGENALLTLYKEVHGNTNEKLSAPSKYILSLVDYNAFKKEKCQARSLQDFYKVEVILAALHHRAARLIYELAQAEKAGNDWSQLNLECMRLSK